MQIMKAPSKVNLRHSFIWIMIPLLIISNASPLAYALPVLQCGAVDVPAAAQPKSIKKGTKGVTLVTPKQTFSANPSDAEIINSRTFIQQLAPTNTQVIQGENAALAQTISAYKLQSDLNDLSKFQEFIARFPNSRWRAALEVNLGERLHELGFVSQSLEYFRTAWDATRLSKEIKVKAIADQAITDLMVLEARLGLTDQLEKDVKQVGNRKMLGSSELRFRATQRSIKAQRTRADLCYRCGPIAITELLNVGKKTIARDPQVEKFKSTKNGTNLAQMKALADKVGLKYQLAKRNSGATLITPCLMHWSVGHFAAIVGKSGDKFHLVDPTFDEGGNLWLSQKALDAETDGYFLVPNGELPAGWSSLSLDEASKIWGKGDYEQPTNQKNGSQIKLGGGPSCPTKMMASVKAYALQATLNIQDTPVGYKPPVGPAINFLINYNHEEAGQPLTFSFTNMGPDWSLNWVCYLTLDTSKNATVRVPGGGYEYYEYTLPDNVSNPYMPDLCSQANLTVFSVNSYQRQLPDGSIQVFNQPDGSGRIFMTQWIDPQGNSAYIQYDANFRATTITDAIGQQSTISYVSNDTTNSGFYLVSQITDTFGRSASFSYDPSNTYLLSSTDMMGLKSQFLYDTSSSFINVMTTPYGSTSFALISSNTYEGLVLGSGLKINYPDGTSEVVENFWNSVGQTNYWDREFMMTYPTQYLQNPFGNYTPSPKKYSWTASMTYVSQPVPVVYQNSIDSATTYTYAGQGTTPDGYAPTPGPINKPITVNQGPPSYYQYNSIGHMTQSIDQVGRTFSYLYAANNIDLLEKRQTQSGNNDLLGKWIYNNKKHLPSRYIDGSGQVSNMTYNAFGELLTFTDPNGSVWTNTYDANGYLIQQQGPLAGTTDVTNISYDGFGRVYQVEDSEGYTVTYSYDAADRLTQTTYPDGTYEKTIYDRLDAVLSKDRIGRWTQRIYDSMDQMIAEIDPLGRKTQYTYCACGSIAALIDPVGNRTTWLHDLEGRVVTKLFQDQTSINYVRDNIGRVITRTDALGQITRYGYNQDNTLNSKIYSNTVNPTPYVGYYWDANYQRLTRVQFGIGDLSNYIYTYNPYITDPFGTPTTGGGTCQ